MTSIFSPDQMREQLRAKNVGEEAIIRALCREFGPGVIHGTLQGSSATIQYVGPILLPFRLTVPWSLLCSDNEREQGGLVRRGDKVYPRKVMTVRYKTAKAAIRDKAKIVVGASRATPDPLAITVNVWLPPSHRNDAINFAKIVGDALEGVVFENDNQLHASHWYRAGVDIDAPRAEISITPL